MERIRDLPPATRMYAVFAAYGKAMMSAHTLERRLAGLIIASVTDTSLPGAEKTTEIERVGRLTLGQLIKEFNASHSPQEELAEELDNMLFFRNELAHRIADTILAAAVEREWEEHIVQELTEYASMFSETSELLRPYTDAWFANHSIDQHKILEAVLKLYPGIKMRPSSSFNVPSSAA